jgi:uncharacterized OB-fold protein
LSATNPLKILPPETEVARPFREGCRVGELRLQYCEKCELYQFYPRIFCSHCGAEQLQWRAVSGRGRIASYTIVRRGISSAYPAPYVVALIDLEEGPRMMSNVVACDPEQVRVNQPVQASFVTWSDEHVLPVFTLAE